MVYIVGVVSHGPVVETLLSLHGLLMRRYVLNEGVCGS